MKNNHSSPLSTQYTPPPITIFRHLFVVHTVRVLILISQCALLFYDIRYNRIWLFYHKNFWATWSYYRDSSKDKLIRPTLVSLSFDFDHFYPNAVLQSYSFCLLCWKLIEYKLINLENLWCDRTFLHQCGKGQAAITVLWSRRDYFIISLSLPLKLIVFHVPNGNWPS